MISKEIERDFNVPVLVQQFGLFLDEKNVLRYKGRVNESTLSLSAKLPTLLPSKHGFAELVIRNNHEQVKHDGIRNTLAATRE